MPDMREAKIWSAVQDHHSAVIQAGYQPVMTVLTGSQNYGLDTESSDYDTFTFVMPRCADIATLRDPVSTLMHGELGHINIKDIRLALNLLKKTSPNSVEWFATKYRLVEDRYKNIIGEHTPWVMFHCNTHHMLNAIGGLAHQLTKRNMPSGKRFSHMLRMKNMLPRFFTRSETDLLGLDEYDRQLALFAKKNASLDWDPLCKPLEEDIQRRIREIDTTEWTALEYDANLKVNDLQSKLVKTLFDQDGDNNG